MIKPVTTPCEKAKPKGMRIKDIINNKEIRFFNKEMPGSYLYLVMEKGSNNLFKQASISLGLPM